MRGYFRLETVHHSGDDGDNTNIHMLIIFPRAVYQKGKKSQIYCMVLKK